MYDLLCRQLDQVLEGERLYIPALANTAALLYDSLPDLNWAGFYLMHEGMLLLGPFIGKPACVRIALGKGVCGTAAKEKRTQLVKDVHLFPGHIACDSASNSEIVIPLFHAGRVVGVMDIDSPLLSRFDESDQRGLEKLAQLIEQKIDWTAFTLR